MFDAGGLAVVAAAECPAIDAPFAVPDESVRPPNRDANRYYCVMVPAGPRFLDDLPTYTVVAPLAGDH